MAPHQERELVRTSDCKHQSASGTHVCMHVRRVESITGRVGRFVVERRTAWEKNRRSYRTCLPALVAAKPKRRGWQAEKGRVIGKVIWKERARARARERRWRAGGKERERERERDRVDFHGNGQEGRQMGGKEKEKRKRKRRRIRTMWSQAFSEHWARAGPTLGQHAMRICEHGTGRSHAACGAVRSR